MDHEARIRAHFSASAELKLASGEALAPALARAAEAMTACLFADGRILACGNGGSAGDAQHFAAELVGRFERERPELAAIALATDTSILTAVANDYSFDRCSRSRCARWAKAATCCSRSPPPATRAT